MEKTTQIVNLRGQLIPLWSIQSISEITLDRYYANVSYRVFISNQKNPFEYELGLTNPISKTCTFPYLYERLTPVQKRLVDLDVENTIAKLEMERNLLVEHWNNFLQGTTLIPQIDVKKLSREARMC